MSETKCDKIDLHVIHAERRYKWKEELENLKKKLDISIGVSGLFKWRWNITKMENILN